MGDLSFEFRDHHDFLAKLNEDYADLVRDRWSSRYAVNVALTAYHVHEWVWEHETVVKTDPRYSCRDDFLAAVNRACPAMPLMRALANGSKHAKITRGKPPVHGTELHRGVFDRTFDSAFDVDALVVTMADGSTRDFFGEATAVVAFWRAAFQSNFRI